MAGERRLGWLGIDMGFGVGQRFAAGTAVGGVALGSGR